MIKIISSKKGFEFSTVVTIALVLIFTLLMLIFVSSLGSTGKSFGERIVDAVRNCLGLC